MAKHGKNACSSSVFSSAERKRVNWGSKKVRLGKESIKDFDACSLCLKQAVDPLCSPDGCLFCKACIYTNLLAQKQDIKARIKLWKKQQAQDDAKELNKEVEKQKIALEKFEQSAVESVLPTGKQVFVNPTARQIKNKYILEKGQDIGSAATADRRTTSRDDVDDRSSHLACHWLPSLRSEGDHKKERLKKPSDMTLNPITNRPLRMKQLRPVKFTETLHDEKAQKSHLSGRYMCGSCRKQLTNATKVHVLSRCGHAICNQCVQLFVLKDKCCPICSAPHSKKYVIKLQMGGTGYVGSGAQAEAVSKLSPAFQC